MPRRILALALSVFVVTAARADAQSFGRNKVHYDAFDFQILQTEHFNVYYYSSEHDAAVQAGRLAERWYARLSQFFDHTFRSRQPIVLYGSHAKFAQTNIIPGFLGEGVGGVTEHEKGRVVLPFAAGLGETDHVLGHELVHAFQRDILRETGRSIATLPLWFLEGMAEYVSVGRIDSNTAMWLRDAARGRLPRIDELNDPRWFPYRYGQALWAYLAGRFGDGVVAQALKSKAPGGAVGRLAAVTGINVRTLSDGWHESIRQMPGITAEELSKPVVGGKRGEGRLNVGPALSPDGRLLIFLSERDQYSIDVFLADAATGAIRRKIVRTAGDPHFDSLQFIESAGAWDPEGRRFAFAALTQGKAVITIVDVTSGRIEREIPIEGVDQIFSPSWSPDGKRIAFSALGGGLSDLHVLDLETGVSQPLTHDLFADLQPAWSPDGSTIAFSTDRFSSSEDTLTFGRFQLAALDVESGEIHALPALAGAKHIDPHWSSDGASLFFIADAGDVSNVYRLSMASGELYQVTNVSTGVSGVTALSPALSVASAADKLAFSVYRNGMYEIHTGGATDGSLALTPTAPPGANTANANAFSTVSPAMASILQAGVRAPLGAVKLPTFGLTDKTTFAVPDGKGFTSKPYRPGLSLNRIVQPYLSAGGGGFGGFLRAGVTLSFGDMLGDHQLQTALQVGKSRNDFIAQAAYMNLHSRWNWGLVGGELPWLTAGTVSPWLRSDDGGTLSRDTTMYRQLHRQAGAVAVYPFSSAKRLELTTGVQHISFDRETTSSVYSSASGQLLRSSSVMTTAAPSATLVETGAALVYDTAIFGPTSPVLGERYRLSVAPTFGSISFTTVTADYRKYVIPIRPITVAMRVMHIGRYGDGATDWRLLPLVWTMRDVVRGYGDGGADQTIGYLSATRMLVGNVELRVPVFDLLGHPAPAMPIEAIAFGDIGRFWAPSALSTANPGTLRSVGAGVRISAAGVIFELDAVRPFDRPSAGWTFAFNVKPGF